jgi:four helix bundle protein
MVQLGHSSTRLPGIKPGLPPPGTKITYFRAKKFTANFPKPETYGLAAQMRRAAVSIPANIAEGFRRRGQADKARFMNMAEGSLEECRYYLILAKDLGYGETASLTAILEEASRMLSAYAAAILTSGS